MARSKTLFSVLGFGVPTLGLCVLVASCRMSGNVSEAALVLHNSQASGAGLSGAVGVEPLKVSMSPPAGWRPAQLHQANRYAYQQWWSQSGRTAVGVTYVRMPLPMNSKMVVTLAACEGGRVIREWTDAIGRQWFEGERNGHRMVGYVLIRGFDAWINYSAWSLAESQVPAELELANRSIETIIPLSIAATVPREATASAAD